MNNKPLIVAFYRGSLEERDDYLIVLFNSLLSSNTYLLITNKGCIKEVFCNKQFHSISIYWYYVQNNFILRRCSVVGVPSQSIFHGKFLLLNNEEPEYGGISYAMTNLSICHMTSLIKESCRSKQPLSFSILWQIPSFFHNE